MSRPALEPVEVRRLLAAALVADVNLDTGDAAPSQFVQMGDIVLFEASNGVAGRQLWKTNGTASGTTLVKQISMTPEILLMPPLPGVTLFFASDPAHGKELWRTDGTAEGTYLLKDINPGSASSPRPPVVTHLPPPERAVRIGDVLYFQATDGVHGLELWRSDGTVDGTYMVRDINPGSAGSGIAHQAAVGDTLYFAAGDATSTAAHLWRSDGTEAGTVRVDPTGNAGIAPRDLTAVGDEVYFVSPGSSTWQLRKSDGTAAGTTPLHSFPMALDRSSQPMWLTAVGEMLLFSAHDGVVGYELWKSDASGTAMVKDIAPDAASASPAHLIEMDGQLFFSATGANGRALWKSDGTEGGTVMVKDVAVASGTPSNSTTFAVFDDALYFPADDGVSGAELWTSDGTEAGTTRVAELGPGRDGGAIANLRAVGGALYFSGNDLLHGRELWRSNGTAGGTAMVTDINAVQNQGSAPQPLTTVDGILYFVATRAATGAELWRSDGTAAGTYLLKDIMPGSGGSGVSRITSIDGIIYFTASDGVHGQELWKTDGTTAGTVMVKDVFPGPSSGAVPRMAAVGDTLYFSAGHRAGDYELWKTDGTEAGTVLVKDILPGTGTAFMYDMVEFNGQLYFGYGWSNQELWRSDGTEAGTVKVKETGGPVGVDHFTVVGDTLYFTGSTGGLGVELWKTDGTAAGTVMVKDINTSGHANPRDLIEFNGRLYFWAVSFGFGDELWTSDGSVAGTFLVKDIYGGATGASGSAMTVGGDYLYFAATDPAHGNELWLSDGSSAGTRLVRELQPGTLQGAIVSPAQMAYANGLLYFAASGTTGGQEIWQTDGTEAGTVLAADVSPGGGHSQPRNLIAAGDIVYFSANDGQRGQELWKLPAPPPAWLAASAGGAYTYDGTTLTINAGTVTLTGDAGADNAAAAAGASIIVKPGASVVFNTTQHLASLHLEPGSSATLPASGDKVLLTRALLLSGDAWLDLNDNDLLLDYAAAGAGAGASPLGSWTGSAYTGVAGMIASAFNFNEWDGPGIRSSAAAASQGLTTLGIGEARDVLFLGEGQTALWSGVTVDATSVIVKYTYIGDADLNGYVDAVDYGTVDNWIQFPGTTGYGNGDFNFDGVIDAVDYGYIDNSIQLQGPAL